MAPPTAVTADINLGLALPYGGARAAPRRLKAARAYPVAVPAMVVAPENVIAGIGFIIASTIFFSVSDVAAKYLTETMSAIEVTWIRYLVFALVMVPFGFYARGSAAFVTRRPGLQLLRGLAVVASSVLFILSLGYLPVAEATATNFIAPIFITALSMVFLRETVGLRRWMAAAVGLAGVLIIVRPGADALQSAALLPVGSALIWAVAAIATRMMSGTDRPETTLVYSALIGLGSLTLVVPFFWVTPNWHQVGIAVLVGLTSTAGHWLLVLGFRQAGASVLAPFSYTQLIWAAGLGFAVFGAVPNLWTFVGGGVIAASGLYTAHREQIRSREARAKLVR